MPGVRSGGGGYRPVMTDSDTDSTDSTTVGIPDEELPEDLVPDDDNPLAEGLPDGETVDGLLTEGKGGEEESSGEEEASGEGDDSADGAAAAQNG